MSIDSLQNRLNEKVANFSQRDKADKRFTQPYRLLKTLGHIEHQFDNLENSIPQDQKMIYSLEKFEKYSVEQLNRRDWRNLAWGLSKLFPHKSSKLLFTNSGEEIIAHFKSADIELVQAIYFPLLYSYFAFEQKEIESGPKTWIQLKNILSKSQPLIFKDIKRPKKWMSVLAEYPELLRHEPTKSFVKEFLSDKKEKNVANTLESLRLASNSWFWDNLIRTTIQSVKTMQQDEYLRLIPRFLNLADKHPIYKSEVLVALLDRYSKTSIHHQVHEVLKQVALNQWGNPQYESSAGWRNVSTNVKNMVIQWFVRADLEAFFNLFSQTADINRFNYWINFIDKISFSQIFLGSSAMRSKQIEHKKFIELNKGRLKELIDSTPTNNAFMLKIDNVYVIDFSDTGNACFVVSKVPYTETDKKISLFTLKPYDNLLKLSHTPGWQLRFDEKLAELGIFTSRKPTGVYDPLFNDSFRR